jgi:hypothetical protein
MCRLQSGTFVGQAASLPFPAWLSGPAFQGKLAAYPTDSEPRRERAGETSIGRTLETDRWQNLSHRRPLAAIVVRAAR